MEVQIKEIEKERVAELVAFVMAFRKELFPMIDHSKLPYDLAHFETCYMEDQGAIFLVATDSTDAIVGTIGMRTYDHRFAHLSYTSQVTNEVLKLYVDPAFRKQGLGTQLVEVLKEVAFNRGIQTLYLHTHPFLTGALEFWQKQAFTLVCQDETPVFRTLHLDFQLAEYSGARKSSFPVPANHLDQISC